MPHIICLKLHTLRDWLASGNAWFADPTTIGYQIIISIQASLWFNPSQKVFLYRVSLTGGTV